MSKDCSDAVAGSIKASIDHSKTYEYNESAIESTLEALEQDDDFSDDWILGGEFSVIDDMSIF